MSTHKNERRPVGRAAPVPVYAGWAPVPCAVWMEVAETLAKPWARVMACADLTVFQSVAIQPVDPVRFPSIGDLTDRWGWSAHEVRKVLVDEPAWSDPTLTGNGDRAARWAAIKESRTSRSGSHGSRKDRARIAQGSHEDSTVEPVESSTKAQGFNTDRARIAITSLNTRVGSQSTDTEHRHREHTAPVPVADLFAPTSQPDAATGEATGDTAPPPSAADPLPKPKRRSSEPSAVDLEHWHRCAAAWGEIHPDKARHLEPTAGFGLELLQAVRKIGGQAMTDRLRLLARDPAHAFRRSRDGKASPLSQFCRASNGHTSALDGEALEIRRSGCSSILESEVWPVVSREPVTTSNAPPAEISEAAAAWASMTFRHEWRLLDRGGVPKRPEDANRDDTPGVVFADDPAEHVRRWHAYRAAGGTKAWREVRGEADRLAFRDAFKAAYESGVISE